MHRFQVVRKIHFIRNFINTPQYLIWVDLTGTKFPFLSKSHYILQGWNLQVDLIFHIKLKIPSFNVDIGLWTIFNLSLISKAFSLALCTDLGPIKATLLIEKQPIWELYFLPYIASHGAISILEWWLLLYSNLINDK